MQKIKSILVFLFCSVALLVNAQAQEGTIRGMVIEEATGEPLIGVSVLLEGTGKGAVTDLDGAFSIKAAEGTYNLKASFISFQPVAVSNVAVKSGQITNVGTIRLAEDVAQLQEVVVTAQALKSSETALLTVKRKSANLIDGVSSEMFSKIGDSDAAAAIRRVPGVSIQGGQYVYVRGLGDRYTKTILNGVEVPGLDPDRNAIQIDIFPTNLIDNIVVYKTFTPELSADFVGGTVNLDTKEFPSEKTFVVSASVEYNPSMHFQEDYLSYQGGKTDFLGFDDGTRDLPFDGKVTEVPSPASGTPKLRSLTQQFTSTMATQRENSLPNLGLGIAAGNQIEKSGYTLGYNASLNYSNVRRFYRNSIDAAYEIRPEAAEQVGTDTYFEGFLGENDVQLSGLLGGSLKTGSSKFNFTLLHIQNGTERAALRERVRSLYNYNRAMVHNLEYTERFLTNVIGSGEHSLSQNTLQVEWKLATTRSTINDKDVRVTPFTLEDEGLEINPQEGGEPNRIWRLLDEVNYVGKLDVTKNFLLFGQDSKVKLGVSNIYKERNFDIQNFFLGIRGSQNNLPVPLNGNPDNLLAEENIYGQREGSGAYRGTYVVNGYNPSNAYEGRINTFGAYVSGELGLTDKLKTILGVRMEQYDQYYTGVNQAGSIAGNPEGVIYADDNVLSSMKFFPSVNFIYSVVENSNLRASYSRTVSRPSFKEKSTAEIQDVITGRTFIGNIDLVETDIDNYDIRWEYFFQQGQTISVGAFYKTFENPIELIRMPQAPNDFMPRNVGNAEIVGLEFEARKNLDFISPVFENFSVSTNLTFTRSAVTIDSVERASRLSGLAQGEELADRRDFLGQPPYMINASLNYGSLTNGWEGNLSYNVQGPTLAVVGAQYAPDTYTVPYQALNFNISKKFGPDMKNKIGLRVTNLLGDKIEREFDSFRASGISELIETYRDPGTAFQLKYVREF